MLATIINENVVVKKYAGIMSGLQLYAITTTQELKTLINRYKENPESIISGEPRTPWIDANNDKLAYRHLNVVCFTDFFDVEECDADKTDCKAETHTDTVHSGQKRRVLGSVCFRTAEDDTVNNDQRNVNTQRCVEFDKVSLHNQLDDRNE